MTAVLAPPYNSFVLDGEIVIFNEGMLSFDSLLLRIHPAESQITKLAKETPATLIAFDILMIPQKAAPFSSTVR